MTRRSNDKRTYRKVHPLIWNDEKFAKLSDEGKLLFLFVLTHPHQTALGAFRSTSAGLAAELKWPLVKCREAFDELADVGMIDLDDDAGFVGLPKFLKYNPPDNPNVVSSWGGWFDRLPECDFKRLLIDRARGVAAWRGPEYLTAFCNAIGQPLVAVPVSPERNGWGNGSPNGMANGSRNGGGNQEQEQEQEQEQDKEPPHPLEGGPCSTDDSADVQLRTKGKRPARTTTPKPPPFDPSLVPIPERLRVPAFLDAWRDWIAIRRKKRKPISEEAADEQLKQLAEAGPDAAVKAIRLAIANDWQGLFPKQAGPAGKPTMTFAGTKAFLEGGTR